MTGKSLLYILSRKVFSINMNHENEKIYYIWLPETKEKVEVNEAVYRAYYRPVWARFKAEHRAGRCACPGNRWAECIEDCYTCSYKIRDEYESLDALTSPDDSDEDASVSNRLNYEAWEQARLSGRAKNVEDVVLDRQLHIAALARSEREFKGGAEMLERMMDGESSREIAKSMGYSSHTTVIKKSEKLRKILAEEFFPEKITGNGCPNSA